MRRRFILPAALLAGALLLAAGCAGGTPPAGEAPSVGTSFLMNTVVEYKLYGPRAKEAQAAIEARLRGIESAMSMYIADSDIGRLNAAAGRAAVPVSEETYGLLERCKEFGGRSGGLFDVTIAPLTAEWGITGEQPRVPEPGRIAELLKRVDYREIGLSTEDGGFFARLSRAGQAVDVGGVAKGYACDAARETALAYGVTAGYVSIGGNLMVIGEKPGGEPFRFGVRDPRGGENDYLAIVTLPDATMATSGGYERYFEQDGVRYHHILDPRTGYPAETDLLSVSVVSQDGALADFLSTYLFLMGRDYVAEQLDSLGCGVIAVDSENNVYLSQSLRGQLTPADETGSYHFAGVGS